MSAQTCERGALHQTTMHHTQSLKCYKLPGTSFVQLQSSSSFESGSLAKCLMNMSDTQNQNPWQVNRVNRVAAQRILFSLLSTSMHGPSFERTPNHSARQKPQARAFSHKYINKLYIKGVRGQIKTMPLSSLVYIWPCQTTTCTVGLKATSCLAPLGRCASKFFHIRSPFLQGWPEDRQVLVLLHLARVAQDRKLDGLARVQAQAELLQRIHGWPHLT